MNEVVQFALQSLRDNSPVGTGKDPHPGLYRDSHTLFVNGNDVADLSSWFPGNVIHIANSVAYSRVLEIGDHKLRIPHHTYELTEQTLRSHYGEIVRVEFTYMGIINKQVYSKSGPRPRTGPKYGRASSRGGAIQNRADLRYPTLIIRGLD
jgi:hypothetical protein